MAKIKLTKGELKSQRDALKQFKRYLPTLQLKKQQLQMKILETRKEYEEKEKQFNETKVKIQKWIGLLEDKAVDLRPWITPEKIDVEMNNIAGATVPFFKSIQFKEADYDLRETPFWTDKGIEQLRKYIQLLAEMKIIADRKKRLEHELTITTQRVNLFEKIKIPECQDNIRKIRIYLGDQQANAVGVSKVAKKKVIMRDEMEALV